MIGLAITVGVLVMLALILGYGIGRASLTPPPESEE